MSLNPVKRLMESSAGMVLLVRCTAIGGQFLLNIFLAAQLGPSSFGIFAFVLAWGILIAGFLRQGATIFVVREIAHYLELGETYLAKYLDRWMTIFIGLMSLIAMALLALANAFVNDPGSVEYNTFLAMLPMVFFMPLMSVGEAVTRGTGRVVRGQLAEFFARPLLGLAISIALVFSFGLTLTAPLAIAALTGATAIAFVIAYAIKPRIGLAAADDRPKAPAGHWLRSLLSLSLVGWISVISVQLPLILLGWLTDPAEVGYYQLAAQISFGVSLMLVIVNSIQAPTFSRLVARADTAGLAI